MTLLSWPSTIPCLLATLLALTIPPIAAAATDARSAGDRLVETLHTEPLQVAFPQIGTDIERVPLRNGIILYLAHDPTNSLLTLTAILRAGGLYRATFPPGTPELVGRQLHLGGTQNLPSLSLAAEFDSRGLIPTHHVGPELMALSIRGLSAYIPDAIRLLADMLKAPAFPSQSIRASKDALLAALRRLPEAPASSLPRELARRLYADPHPVAHPYTATDLNAITRDHILAFHRHFIRPDNLWILAVSNQPTPEVLSLLEAAFGDWTTTEPPIDPIPPVTATLSAGGVLLLHQPVEQATLVMGHLGVARTDPDRYALEILNLILGGNGFASRLTSRLRTQEGLTYGVTSGFPQIAPDRGLFQVMTHTRVANVPRAIHDIVEEIERLQTTPPPLAEVHAAIESKIGTLLATFAIRPNAVAQILGLELLRDDPDFFRTCIPRYRAVTPAMIQRVAQEHLHPRSLTILVSGPEPDLRPALAAFGPVQVIPALQ